jgi:hypothetical protein
VYFSVMDQPRLPRHWLEGDDTVVIGGPEMEL